LTGLRIFGLMLGLFVAGSLPALARAGDSKLEIVLKPAATRGAAASQRQLDRAAEIMRSRLAQLGAHGSVVHRPNSRAIIVRLEGVGRSEALSETKAISRPGRLELYDLEASLLPPSIDRRRATVATTSLFKLLRGKRQMTVPANAAVLTCEARTAIVCPGLAAPPERGRTYYYLVKRDPAGARPVPQMTGDELQPKSTRQDLDPATGAPVVTIGFTRRGNQLFHELTRAAAVRGKALGVPQHVAIVLDDQIRSWPQIDFTRYPDGIDPSGGGAQIAGLPSISDAREVALVLRTGALPVAFSIDAVRARR
jgi:preprotein translocase subunit SecD